MLEYFSCAVIDLRTVKITTTPEKPECVLSGEYTPVIIHFDAEMEHYETEKILTITSATGAVEGDISWKGNDLYFVPVHGWNSGIRYTIGLAGTVHSLDGREARLERFISFYAINKSASPLLVRFTPADGESVGTGDTVMELRFSCPMDQTSTEFAFSIEGMTSKKFEWSENDSVLKIISEKPLGAWSFCRWTLKNSAKSRDGVPLAKTFSASFIADKDRIQPKVQRVFPALNADGRWIPTGASIENGLGPEQGIVVEFNKAAGDNVLRCLRFDPPLAGRTESLSDNAIVFIPNKDPDPEKAYTLIVSADTKDSEGLKLGEDFKICFVADIPYLEIVSINIDNGSIHNISGSSSTGIIPVFVDPTDGQIGFTISFSCKLSAEEKQNAALRISLVPFFPGTLDPVALRSVVWISDDRIRMQWEKLKKGKTGEKHYYKLVIPGGKNGIVTGEGMYLKEDQLLYLEAMQ